MKIYELIEAISSEVFPINSETLKIGSQGNTVKAWQWSLKKLLDTPIKIDGKFGEQTKQATVEFQSNNNITNDGVVGRETYSMANRELSDAGVTEIPFLKEKPGSVDTKDSSVVGEQEARSSADRFLGRPLEDQEWDNLLRAVFAESSPNTKERAYIMGVILNRVRTGKWGNTVIDVLYAKNQFQAVTGTRYNRGPSSNFKRGPKAEALGSIFTGAAKILPNVPKRFMNFTAASRAAYGKGTNVGFRDTLLAKGGIQIGGTIFA
jgi:peptidoglycan hydrolase-like protein with peptidoglycan-binding domain